MTDKEAALVAAMHAYDERGGRGDGKKTINELETELSRVTNETIRALRVALVRRVQEKRLCSRLTAVIERYLTDTLVDSLSEKYRGFKLMTCIQAARR